MCVQHFHVDHTIHQLLGCVVMVMVEFCGHCVCMCVVTDCYFKDCIQMLNFACTCVIVIEHYWKDCIQMLNCLCELLLQGASTTWKTELRG